MLAVYSCDKWNGILSLFYLSILALSLDADPLDISVPSHIRGRQTENEDKNTVSAVRCQRASLSLLAATTNVSFHPDIIITLYIVSGVWRFVCLGKQSAVCLCPLNWLIVNAALQQLPSVNWEVFILAEREPISTISFYQAIGRQREPAKTGRNAHVD